ncbi:helix-turn-helix domain-containing protein [Pseudonocardia yuanmonensis]|uniref:Helix-turn-helix domain-containing protein n=1 Tax=Pseudonocardia yuanmonensis TaxID=1095914 RepID=A0ABP8XHM7_9PSEU
MPDSSLPLHACHYTEEVFALLGKRWNGLLVDLLLERPPRFDEVTTAVPQLSRRGTHGTPDRAAGGPTRTARGRATAPVAVTYRKTQRGIDLRPALDALRVRAAAPTDSEGNPLPFSAAGHEAEAG